MVVYSCCWACVCGGGGAWRASCRNKLLPWIKHRPFFPLQFEEFYTHKHSGRVLSWLHHLSLAELRMGYTKRAYTVCVSTYQMAVLLAYNESDSHTTASLAHATQLPSQELATTIQSLLDSKILLETTEQGGVAERGGESVAGKDGEDAAADNGGGVAGTGGEGVTKEGVAGTGEEQIFRLNMNYSNKRTKFKITAMMQKDSQQVKSVTMLSPWPILVGNLVCLLLECPLASSFPFPPLLVSPASHTALVYCTVCGWQRS